MKKMVTVEKTEDGYSAFVQFDDVLITAMADSYAELKKEMEIARAFACEDLPVEKAKTILSYRLNYCLEVQSFFELFPTLNIAGFAKFIGLNASLLRQYAKGIKKPSEKRSEQILKGIHDLGDLYREVRF